MSESHYKFVKDRISKWSLLAVKSIRNCFIFDNLWRVKGLQYSQINTLCSGIIMVIGTFILVHYVLLPGISLDNQFEEVSKRSQVRRLRWCWRWSLRCCHLFSLVLRNIPIIWWFMVDVLVYIENFICNNLKLPESMKQSKWLSKRWHCLSSALNQNVDKSLNNWIGRQDLKGL